MHKCQYCVFMFKTNEEKETHVKDVHKTSRKRVKCVYCREVVSGRMFDHVRSFHESLALRCSFRFCGSYFLSEQQLQKHISQVHELELKLRIECIYCGASMRRRDMIVHVRNKHQSVAIKCDYHSNCSHYFLTEEERQKHILEVHESGENRVRCIYCGIVVTAIGEHVKKLHKEAIKCKYYAKLGCPIYFLTEEERRRHYLEVHESGAQLLTCVYCEKKVKVMAFHVSRHHKSEAIKCNFNRICANFFRTKEERRKHILEVHQLQKEKQECIICGKMIQSASALKLHVRRIHLSKGVKCRFVGCDKYSFCKSEQEKHFRKEHTENEDPDGFKCAVCDTKYLFKDNLEEYILKEHVVL